MRDTRLRVRRTTWNVFGGRHGASLRRAAIVTAAVSLLVACGKENPTQESVPVIKEPSNPLLAINTTGNGPGRCLEADVDAAGLTSGGTPLNCTANDIDIAVAKVSEYSLDGGATFITLPEGSRINCTNGQEIKVRTSALLQNNAQDRYDIGLWINPVPGESALTATGPQACQHYNLVNGAVGVSNSDTDSCGDMQQGGLTTVPLDVITLKCEDPDGNGAVELSACASWQNSAGRTCPTTDAGALAFRYGTTPETKSKCNCEPLALPIDIKGILRVKKVTLPAGDPASFAFTATGTGYTAPFSLKDGETNVSNPLSAGTYTASETVPAGWELLSRSCVITGTATPKTFTSIASGVSVALGTGEDVTCTFTNRKLGSLTIVKDANPNAAQDFAFTTTGTGLSAFSLDDDADPALSNTRTFENLAVGPYTVTETATAGWSLTSLSCTTGGTVAGAVATINLTAGANVTCTFTNTKDATLTVVKVAEPKDGTDFAFTATGTGTSGFSLDDDADGTLSNTKVFTFPGAQLGAKTVTESALAGWALTNLACTAGSVDLATRTASVTLAAGDDVTCTFTNTKAATITVVKNAVPDDAQDFTFTPGGSGWGVASFPLDDDGETAILSNQRTFTFSEFGAKTVVEGLTAGWTLLSVSCTKGTGDVVTRTASVTIVAGDAVVCTFTNRKQGSLTIVKDATPNSLQDFGFTATGAGLSGFSLDDDAGVAGADGTLSNTRTFNNLADGSYSVTESDTPGWTLSNLVCNAGGTRNGATANITITDGANVTCTFTNRQLGSITIVKNAEPNDAQDFAFTTSGSGLSAFSLDDDADATLPSSRTFTNLADGSYSVTESATSGWALSSLTCTSGGTPSGSTANITITNGANVTCTFVNAKLPTLTLRKTILGGTTPFTFALTGAGVPATATITPPTNGTGTAATVNALVIQPGAYTIDETNIPSGWILTDKACTGASSTGSTATGVTFTAALGQTITCTFVDNQANGSTTRTQGFWSTHTSITTAIWNGTPLPSGTGNIPAIPVIGTEDAKLCGPSDLNISEVFGGFWANIAKKYAGGQRTQLEKFRMQMLQQYLAAVLNVHAFATPLPSGYSLAGARTAYCGTDVTAINQYKSILAGYNEQFDSGQFTPGASATAQLSRSTANIPFWDNTFQKP